MSKKFYLIVVLSLVSVVFYFSDNAFAALPNCSITMDDNGCEIINDSPGGGDPNDPNGYPFTYGCHVGGATADCERSFYFRDSNSDGNKDGQVYRLDYNNIQNDNPNPSVFVCINNDGAMWSGYCVTFQDPTTSQNNGDFLEISNTDTQQYQYVVIHIRVQGQLSNDNDFEGGFRMHRRELRLLTDLSVSGSTNIPLGSRATLDWRSEWAVEGREIWMGGPISGYWNDPAVPNNGTWTVPRSLDQPGLYDFTLKIFGPSRNNGSQSITSQTVYVQVDPITPPSGDINCNGQNSCSITSGSSATISWSSSDTTSCTASNTGDGTTWSATSDSRSTGALTSSRTYNLRCDGPGGNNVLVDSVDVTVTAAVPLPEADILCDQTRGSCTITSGSSANIEWCGTGSQNRNCLDATSCTVTFPGGSWSGLSNYISTGPLTSSKTYTLSCTNATGTTTDTVDVNISAATYTLNINSSGAAGVSIASSTGHQGTTNYSRSGISSGTNVVLTAPATAGGSAFIGWTGCTSVGGAGNRTCSKTVNANSAVVANYGTAQVLNVVSTGVLGVPISSTTGHEGITNYSITGIASGTNVILTAPSNMGLYVFSSWAGCTSVSGNTCNKTLNIDSTLTANYVAGPQPVPSVTTNAVTNITATGATLNGTANPNGAVSTGWFRYSTANPGTCNDTFGTRVPATGGSSLGSGTAGVAYSQALSGLTTGTTYYYCAIASNSAGNGYGNVLSFVPASAFSPSCAVSVSPSGGTPDPVTATITNSNFNFGTRWNFKYDCADDGTYEHQTDNNKGTNPYVDAVVCGYQAGNNYTFRVLVEDTNNTAINTTCTAPIGNPRPNYITEGLATAPGSLITGQAVSFSATVRNSGTGNASVSSATRLRLDLDNNGSYDQTFTNASTGALIAGATEVETWSSVWTAVVGTHKFEVCADTGSVVSESNEGDNCTTQTFTVSAPGQPDLIITAFSVPNGTPGQVVPVSVTVQNTGTAAAGAFEVAVNRDRNSMACNTAEHGRATVSSLAAGASVTVTPDMTLPNTVNTFTAVAMADSDCAVTESNETNNTRTTLYTVANAPTLSAVLSANPASGASPLNSFLRASATGTATGTINYNFWWNCLSASNVISAVNTACGSLPVPLAGACASNSVGYKCDGVNTNPQDTGGHIYTPAGTYNGKVIIERSTATPAEQRVPITVSTVAEPDLVVTAFSVPNGTPGQVVPVSVTVQNTGTDAAGAFEVAVNRDRNSMACNTAEH
ncbi:MAG: hypothetical protein HYT62_05045, partial [Candidatus Yanofskybacteria bacterium]|nr:hypothetical protein [Candidatus Yanofskybacteria bacterium]